MWHTAEMVKIFEKMTEGYGYDIYQNRKLCVALCNDLFADYSVEKNIMQMLFQAGLGEAMKGVPFKSERELKMGLSNIEKFLMAQAIEKDYYVTLLLQILAQEMPYIVFKGGTSLSKCHKVIQRFSEDIDITIDTLLSQGQKRKAKQIILDAAAELGLVIDNLDEIRSRRDYNRYVLSYNSVIPMASDALKPAVLLETSYTAVSFPTVLLPVHSYVGDMMQNEVPNLVDEYHLSPFEMKVQGIDRTLADKVFAICDYYLQSKTAKHSRHLYDIYKLLPLVPQDEKFRQLLQEVRAVRAQSVVCPSAQPEVNISDLLLKIINEKAYKQDYDVLTSQLLEEPVPYNTAVKALEQIAESRIF